MFVVLVVKEVLFNIFVGNIVHQVDIDTLVCLPLNRRHRPFDGGNLTIGVGQADARQQIVDGIPAVLLEQQCIIIPVFRHHQQLFERGVQLPLNAVAIQERLNVLKQLFVFVQVSNIFLVELLVEFIFSRAKHHKRVFQVLYLNEIQQT